MKFGLGLLFSAWVLFSGIILPLMIQAGGLHALPYVYAMVFGTHVVDYFISPAPTLNLASLRAHGFSQATIVSFYATNLLGFPLAYLPAYFLAPAAHAHYDLALVCNLALCLVCSELLFTLGHTWLHSERGARFHVFHHACRRTSASTNLLFDPRDLAVELAPALVCAYIPLLFGDAFSMWVAFAVMLAWYAADHDEALELYHSSHHKYVDSNYCIYACAKHDPNANAVPALMTAWKRD